MVLIGIGADDTKEIADKLVRKLVNMRIFEDAEGRTNLGLKDVEGRTFAYFPVLPFMRTARRATVRHLQRRVRRRWQSRWSNISLKECKKEIPVVEQGELCRLKVDF